MFGVWFLGVALSFMTTTTALVAFQRAPDRSMFALVQWVVIALAAVVPLFLIPALVSPGPRDASAARRLCSRVLIVVYLPLTSALMLLAFGAR
jgi:hypothetical protein